MAEAEPLSASLEDYLETIFHVINEKRVARARDISGRMKVCPSSVTGALRTLSARGLINYAPYDVVTLTDEGEAAAAKVVRRHRALRDFFVKVLAIGEDEANKAACDMEHAVPKRILDRLQLLVEFSERVDTDGGGFLREFNHYCDHGALKRDCALCGDK